MLPAARSFTFRTHRRLHFSTTTASSLTYDHDRVEKKWQKFWKDENSFKAIRRPGKEKKFVLDMFPYPSGSGLHVGHPEGYTASDIMARYWRMNDFDVLHPMGWDAFGLPAEQYAIQTGIPPAETTKKNIATFKRQMTSLGFSIDWGREIATTDKSYFKWTQWLFLRLFRAGYVEQSSVPVNWCAGLGSVLANEEVIGGVSERGGFPVERLPLRQWLMKITKMADELEDGLEDLDWPQGTLTAQKSWIGRSEGAEVSFICGGEKITVFTTRPDTVLGVTYVVLSPESPLVSKIVSSSQANEVGKYVSESAVMSDMTRMQGRMTGVDTGATAQHPLTGEQVPVWVARHVLGSYGTGCMMAVPSTDKKDLEFAELFDIPLTPSTDATLSDVLIKEGISIEGGDMKEAATVALEKRGVGVRSVQYKLRDWVFSRQRYWGEPIPIFFPVRMSQVGGDPRRGDEHVIDYDTPMPVPDDELPLCLPEMDDITPGDDPAGCLAKCVDWRYFQTEAGDWFARETNTMPQWAGSCWYYLRFTDPTNDSAPWSLKGDLDWMPVDLYVGGNEHAVLHLLYARFWHKVFYSLGLTTTKEPFTKLVHQGMILGSDGEKMSKSRGNVVNPDDIVSEFGADALRLYEMFMGPLDAVKPWQTEQITGVVRFRNRVFALASSQTLSDKMDSETEKLLHKTMKKVTQDIDKMSFNTAISSMMILSNHLASGGPPREAVEKLVIMLSPLAPHLCEECWELLGKRGSLVTETWVTWDEELCNDDTVKVALQVNGKTKGVVEVSCSATEEEVRTAALLQLPGFNKAISAKTVKKSIFIAGKILNLVV